MSLHATPEDHAADPPAAWSVRRAGPRSWALCSSLPGNAVLDRFTARRAAEAARTTGHAAQLYAKEGRWFAGQPVTGWRPWADVLAERQRREARFRPQPGDNPVGNPTGGGDPDAPRQ